QGAKRAAVAVGRAGPAEETLTGRHDRYGYDHRDRDQEGAEDEAQSDRPSPERAESRCAHGRWDGVAERSDRHAAQQYGGLLGGAAEGAYDLRAEAVGQRGDLDGRDVCLASVDPRERLRLEAVRHHGVEASVGSG